MFLRNKSELDEEKAFQRPSTSVKERLKSLSARIHCYASLAEKKEERDILGHRRVLLEIKLDTPASMNHGHICQQLGSIAAAYGLLAKLLPSEDKAETRKFKLIIYVKKNSQQGGQQKALEAFMEDFNETLKEEKALTPESPKNELKKLIAEFYLLLSSAVKEEKTTVVGSTPTVHLHIHFNEIELNKNELKQLDQKLRHIIRAYGVTCGTSIRNWGIDSITISGNGNSEAAQQSIKTFIKDFCETLEDYSKLDIAVDAELKTILPRELSELIGTYTIGPKKR